MPIWMKMDAVKGKVTAEGHSAAGANGGIWRTTNFLTNDPNAIEISRISFGGRTVDAQDPMPVVKAVQLFEEARSRRNGNLQITQLYVGGNRGQLLVGVDKVTLSTSYDAQGRLVMGTDQGVWRSGGGVFNGHHTGALRNVSNNNTSRPGVGMLKSVDGGRTWPTTGGVGALQNMSGDNTWIGATRNVPVVEIIVSDRGSMNGRVFRLENVTISPTGGGATASISLNFQKIEFKTVGMGGPGQ